MKKINRRIPKFKNEDEEREFWAIHSSLDYFDSSNFRKALFPNLRPSLKSISIRLPEDMLATLKTLAHKKDVPYQSLAKVYIARQIVLEKPFFRAITRTKRRRKVHAQPSAPLDGAKTRRK